MAIVASAIAFRLESQLDPAEVIRSRLGSSPLAEIPRPRFRSRSKRLVSPLSRAWSSGLEEAVDRLCTNLEVRLIGLPSASVAVTSLTSATPGQDVAALMGWTLASGGKQVAIIDADVSRPSLHERFGVPLHRGLSDVPRDGRSDLGSDDTDGMPPYHLVPIESRPRAEGRLEVVTAGSGYFRPTEVMSRRLPLALDAMADGVELVLTVCPALEDSPEAWLAVASIPNAVLVIESSDLDVPRMMEVVARMRDQKVELLGVVLTGVKHRRGTPVRRSPTRAPHIPLELPEIPTRSSRVGTAARPG
jgi:Mrp family chromosome partitioning ATPase